MKNLLKMPVVALALFSLSFAYSQDEPPCNGASGAAHFLGGGFVADTVFVAETAFVGPHAQVCDSANVKVSQGLSKAFAKNAIKRRQKQRMFLS